MTSLERLNLNNSNISDAGLAKIKELPHLKVLSLENCPKITDDGIKHLVELPQLELLAVGAPITTASTSHFAQMKRLRELTIFGRHSQKFVDEWDGGPIPDRPDINIWFGN